MKYITEYTEQGITVRIMHSVWQSGRIDCIVYFVGDNADYMPTTHDTIDDAMQHATQFIDRYVADGGLQGYRQRMGEHYASLQ